ncbi:amidase [Phenylobacterium sp.]|jgi:amidase|uniref:amidase n=1 Tax=Phenylobacterium sp. TaxID=1871053 RepID=UPI000C8F26A3|nr:amidase [Phenylobacterium sp.]MAK82820.1 6-aminohexanoate hydrolase [Phenylobacterium sp.]|tara:strand:- start:35586 stop:37013 length:1428 start_codon:yes stop_codon:yes gene_type:complete
MAFDEYAEHDALGLAALVAKGEVSPAELVEAAITRVERHNGVLNAVVHKAYDEARATAKGHLPDGPFKGVPFLIKDLGAQVKGWPRTSGSRFAQVAADDADSELVARYRAAGVVLLGKSNTPEFGIPGVTNSDQLGACRNPWNPDHISGGSSGGAASATAAGMVPLAHASDGLGSIRIPAACCGLFGMKITRDRTPICEVVDGALGFSVHHVVSRTVRDSAAMLDATGYPQAGDPFQAPAKDGPYLDEVAKSPGRLRIAWSAETPSGRPIPEEMLAHLLRTVELLKGLGHEVFEKGLGVDYRQLYRAQSLASASNFSANVARWVEKLGREPGEDELGPLARRGYEAGKRLNGQQAFWGFQQLRLMNRQILSAFEDFDVYLTPVMSTPAPRIDWLDPNMADTREFDKRQAATYATTPPANFTGQPSMSVPLWESEEGLPVGMMFTGRFADEATLYRLAGQLEKEQPWKDRRPALWN